MKQQLELRRIRDFGEIINDTFTFLKENFKPLFKALFIVCGVFILAGGATTALTMLGKIGIGNAKMNPGTYGNKTQIYSFFIMAMINAVILAFAQFSIYLVTLCYISVYLEKKGGTPTFAEIWGYYKYYFLRILGGGILIFLLFMFGLLLCVIPGLYLMPPLYLIFPIIVMENTSFGYGFNKSFSIIKGNWWMVFGLIIVMGIIVSVLGALVSVPLQLITTAQSFLSLKGLTTPVVIVFSVLQNVIMLTYTLPAIALTMCYFSLSEQKDGTGILNRIDMFGKKPDTQTDLPSEQY
ncbi:hypothetical protein SAMN05216464_11628 [Mucilaginibacter pineti]|uniref:DUF7847 domain-containing protein n=1 Tax=Mucilaginibacter pineti TaxID=1391627 RepID=A0A1G7K7P6_9SPHI|nr:hypothetical protein [Mucilaginibacter pineti]SDF33273.1 hypothetical protein SAMN05216464_11628 [Mucilaginibacter pineti]